MDCLHPTCPASCTDGPQVGNYPQFWLQMCTLLLDREGLPLTMKSCFYPLIGDKIFGWPGDLVRPSERKNQCHLKTWSG